MEKQIRKKTNNKLEYNNLVRNVKLIDIILKSSKIDFNDKAVKTNDDKVKFEGFIEWVKGGKNIFNFYHTTKLIVENRKNYLFKIDIVYLVRILSEDNLSDNFLGQFADRNINLIVHPFLREFITNVTAKMNVPPLILPFIIQRHKK